MKLKQKVNILSRLGLILNALGKNEEWSGYAMGISETEYNDLNELVKKVHIHNGWFTEKSVRESFLGISKWLNEEDLEKWIQKYGGENKTKKNVALIMAGNIPLVGFHDFISAFLSGHKSIIKLSSDDQHLFPAIIDTLKLFDPEIDEYVEIPKGKLSGFDAVIATGSDNSAKYFESYFGKHPNIIRKNRTSIAVLTGDETEEELRNLGKDIFTYFGLGCRNVSHIKIPKDFDLDIFFKGIYDFNQIINHNKYANNYDYNKAVYLMNKENLLDNGFILLKEDDALQSPLGMLFYSRYSSQKDLDDYLNLRKDNIQAVIGKNYIPFGEAQCPSLTDYADGVDTMEFLHNI